MYMAYELVDVSYVHPGLTQSYTYTYPHNLPTFPVFAFSFPAISSYEYTSRAERQKYKLRCSHHCLQRRLQGNGITGVLLIFSAINTHRTVDDAAAKMRNFPDNWVTISDMDFGPSSPKF